MERKAKPFIGQMVTSKIIINQVRASDFCFSDEKIKNKLSHGVL
ncbi:MAG: hypothetical protein Q4G08_02885 [Capnocytophaga sp.]|nr:hypothetical protein [Capnocytophaga sp.]